MSAEKIATTPERLKEAMKLAKKRQADLVRETGLDKGSISNYLSGRYEPKSDAIAKLAIALNVSEMWLYGYDVRRTRTAEQQKRDKIVELYERIQEDPDLFEVVEMLAELQPEDRAVIKQMISALTKK